VASPQSESRMLIPRFIVLSQPSADHAMHFLDSLSQRRDRKARCPNQSS
jgi:hypothetical protein